MQVGVVQKFQWLWQPLVLLDGHHFKSSCCTRADFDTIQGQEIAYCAWTGHSHSVYRVYG